MEVVAVVEAVELTVLQGEKAELQVMMHFFMVVAGLLLVKMGLTV